jgi:hypothetical protein
VTAPVTSRRPDAPVTRTGFGQLLRSEWTKFRTVRGWPITLLAVVALTAILPSWLASTATTNDPETCTAQGCQVEGRYFATGPSGTAVLDAFTFVHQPVGADGSITARVAGLHGTGHVSPPLGFGPPLSIQPWAKAGLMIKASTRPGAPYAAVMLTGSHGIRMQDGFSHDLAGPAAAASQARWLRLTRAGDTITGWASATGSAWTEVGTVRVAGLPATAQAGIFVTSPDFSEAVGSGDNQYSTRTQAAATFTGLRLAGGTGGTGGTGTAGTAGRSWADAVVSDGDPVLSGPAGTHRVKCGSGCHEFLPSPGVTRRAGTYTLTGSGDIAPFTPIVDPVHVAFLATLFGLIAVIGLGAVFITAEYRRSLIRTTLAATPRRGRVLLAKGIVVGGATFAAALIGTAIAFPVAGHELARNGWKLPVWTDYALTSGTGLQVVIGTAATAAAVAVLALAAGTVFRRGAGAVTAVIGLVVMPLVLAIVLPLGPATWLLRLTPAAAFSLQSTVPHYSQVASVCSPYHGCFPLLPWSGFAVLCAWAAAALAGAIWLLRRRDV